MKKLTHLVLILIVLVTPIFGFESDDPPPNKTLAWTTSNLANVVVPVVDFKEASVESVTEILSRRGMPKDYAGPIETKNLGELASHPITLKGRNMRLLEIIVIVAEEIGAKLVITPGKVTITK
jgi:hypothetical protein